VKVRRAAHRDDTGASAVEYGLIVFAIAAVIVAVVVGLGQITQSMFSDSCSTIGAKVAPSSHAC
jgi:pilus assembly protein Flp/PilA